jgi:DNA-binding GntR family transcriptional regulator
VTALATGLTTRQIADMHRPILEALRARDGERAAREIEAHLGQFATLMMELEDTDQPAAAADTAGARRRRPFAV